MKSEILVIFNLCVGTAVLVFFTDPNFIQVGPQHAVISQKFVKSYTLDSIP